MKIFYTILFCGAGCFNILAALFGWSWYVDYWAFRKNRPWQKSSARSRAFSRTGIAVIGLLLLLYGIAYCAELI